MKKRDDIIELRCFAYKNSEDEKYYAHCIDLNLADHGNSIEEVKEILYENIKLCVDTESGKD